MAGEVIYRQIALAFKRVLKERRVTYEDLATGLDVSERTIKRMMNGDDSSIVRIAEACEAIGVKFFDLMELAKEQVDDSFQLTLEQEEFLAASLDHYVIFRALMREESFTQILDQHDLTRSQLRNIVKELEEFDLAERHPGDVVISSFSHRPQNYINGGPLQQAVGLRDLEKFMKSLYREPEGYDFMSTSSGTKMSRESIDAWIDEADRLSDKYVRIAQREQSVLADEKLVQIRWLSAIVYPFKSWIDEVRLGAEE